MAFDNVVCLVDEVTELAVCRVDDVATKRLHEAIERISIYLEHHHLAWKDEFDTPYHYREGYLPDQISGNDVVGVNRAILEAKARVVFVPAVLMPLDSNQRGPVTSEDVAYLSRYALEIADGLDSMLHDIYVWDAGRGGVPRWLVLFGLISVSMAIGGIVASRRKS